MNELHIFATEFFSEFFLQKVKEKIKNDFVNSPAISDTTYFKFTVKWACDYVSCGL